MCGQNPFESLVWIHPFQFTKAQNFYFQCSKTSNAILSFTSLTRNPSSTVIKVNSLVIWFIGQTRPTSYFLHGSSSMNTTFNSWTQLMWMGIFLTESWFPFFFKWNLMKVFGFVKNLATQTIMLGERPPYFELYFRIQIV
jgi:hypothetical protein